MDEFGLDDNYPGIDRLQYFLGKAGMIAAVVFTVTVFGPESPVMKVVSLAVMVGGVVLDVMRLRNIGVSQWLVFLRFLPFGGLILDFGLVTAQTGWAKERQLDRAGKTILIFCLVLLAMMLFMWFRVGMAAPWYL
jgi:uncharacterized membrane protein YhaH (DUF805 family)